MGGDAGQVDAAVVVLEDEQDIEPAEKTVPTWKKPTAAIDLAWADRNCFQLASIPADLRITQMVEGAILYPRPVRSPQIRR